jgi:hypothetical protein
MKTLFKAAILTAILVSGINTAKAEKINAWQHCGLGAAIFPDNGTAAAVSNIIWDLGTTALTSQMSSEETCSGNRGQTVTFIKETFPALENDVAMGEGEYISAMLELRGCDASVAPAIREAYQASEKGAEALFNSVEAVAVKACNNV